MNQARNTSTADVTSMPGSVTIRVDDMSCNHCVGTIKRAIETAIPGARTVVDLDQHLVSVQGADAAKVCEAITVAGYTPVAT